MVKPMSVRASPRPLALMSTPYASYLLHGSDKAGAPPSVLALNQQAPLRRGGWRPASAKRSSAGGGARSQFGCLRTDASAATVPQFMQEMHADTHKSSRPQSAREAPTLALAPREGGTPPSTGEPDAIWARLAATARLRLEAVIFAPAAVGMDHPSAYRAKTLCSLASDEYERELLRVLRFSSDTGHGDSGGELLRRCLASWRGHLEKSGAILQAALAAQSLAAEEPPVGGVLDSLRQLLDNEMVWVLQRARDAAASAWLRKELSKRLRRCSPPNVGSALPAVLNQIDVEDLVRPLCPSCPLGASSLTCPVPLQRDCSLTRVPGTSCSNPRGSYPVDAGGGHHWCRPRGRTQRGAPVHRCCPWCCHYGG